MRGLSTTTGKVLDGIAHLRQSIGDILSTPIGSRVMRRDYGSRLFELVDAPFNASTRVQIFAAAAEALFLWEPRITLDQIELISNEAGHLTIDVHGTYHPSGQSFSVAGVVI